MDMVPPLQMYDSILHLLPKQPNKNGSGDLPALFMEAYSPILPDEECF